MENPINYTAALLPIIRGDIEIDKANMKNIMKNVKTKHERKQERKIKRDRQW